MATLEPGWAALAAAIAPTARVRRVRRLGGGLATDTFAFDLVDATERPLVVKRYREGDEIAPLEWECLHFAQRVAVPRPEPVAYDADGDWFGLPAVVMTRLPGRAYVTPTDLDDWLRQLAGALAAVHDTDPSGAVGAILTDPDIEAPELLRPSRRSVLVERCLRAIDEHLPSATWPPVVTHGDLHPGNVIWTGNTLSGVVDWSGTVLGARWYEVAYCRADVALLLGVKAADRLTHHYVTITGRAPVDLALFDLICGLRARESASRWLDAYREQGRTDTPRQFAARVTPFLRQALANLEA